MNTITVRADNKMSKALIPIFEAFGHSFNVKKKKEKDSSYDPEFVDMVLKARDEEGYTLMITKNSCFRGVEFRTFHLPV